MKKFIPALVFILTIFGVAFAEEKAPTVMSNKEAIDLVQTHANYLWTLVAAVLVFFMGRFCSS